MSVLLLGLVLLLGACSGDKTEKVAVEPEETEVAENEVVEEEAEAAEEESPEEEASEEVEESEASEEDDAVDVEAAENWAGRWMHEAYPDAFGELVIFDETDEGFSFSLRILSDHVAEFPKGYAVKDGETATLVDDEQGCELVLHREGSTIRTEQKSNGCMYYHGAGISLESTFSKDGMLVMDSNFPELLKEGKLSADSYPMGTDYETIVAELGETAVTQSSGGAILKYHSPIFYGVDYQTESGPVYALESWMVDSLSIEEVKAIMGEPESEGISDIDGSYFMYYNIEDKYKVFLKLDSKSKMLQHVMMAEL